MVVGSSVSSLSSSIISNSSMSSSIRSFSSKSLVSSGSISLFVMEVLLSSIKLFGQQFVVVVVSFSSTITAVSFVVFEGFGMVLNETSVLLLPSSIFRRSLSVSVASERENDRRVRCKH